MKRHQRTALFKVRRELRETYSELSEVAMEQLWLENPSGILKPGATNESEFLLRISAAGDLVDDAIRKVNLVLGLDEFS